MRSLNLLLVLVVALGGAAPALASEAEHGHEAHAQASYEGQGVVKVVNAKDGKVKIAHEPISALGWPAMTMWFRLSAPFPPGIGIGDGVRFDLHCQGRDWVIVRIERGK